MSIETEIRILVVVTKYERKMFRGEIRNLNRVVEHEQKSLLYRNHWFIGNNPTKRGVIDV